MSIRGKAYNLDATGPGQSRDNSNSTDEILRDVNESLTAVENLLRTSYESVIRAIPDPEEQSGQVLENAVSRQLTRRRDNLSTLRENFQGLRDRSVIFFTSTPDISIELRYRTNQPESVFSFEEANPSEPQLIPTHPPPLQFQIYQGPEPSPRRIPVIQTPITDPALDQENIFTFPDLTEDTDTEENPSTEQPANTEESPVDLNAGAVTMAGDVTEKDRILKDTKKLIAKLKAFTLSCNPELYSPQVLKLNKADWMKDLKEVNNQFHELLVEVEDYALDEAEKKDLAEMTKNVELVFSRFVIAIDTKILSAEASGSKPTTSDENKGSLLNNLSKIAEINADVDSERLLSEVKELSEEVRKIQDWSSAEDHQVQTAMSKVETWKSRMRKIKENHFSLKKTILSNNLDRGRFQNVENSVATLESEVNMRVEEVIFEDGSRELYSEAKGKSAEVKLPTFSGANEEDYWKFEKELKEGFRTNRVSRDAQSKKLKEVLKGQAKTLIPTTEDNIDRCLKILKDMYGKASRVTKAKKSKLVNLGSYPNPTSKKPQHVKSRLEWLVTMDQVLEDMFALAEKDTDSYCEVYAPSFATTIKGFFPENMHTEFCEVEGDSKIVLRSVHTKVQSLVRSTRSLLSDVEGSAAGNAPSGGAGGQTGGGGVKANQWTVSAAIRDEKCRICRVLESEGDTDVYEDHYSRYLIGCPRFAMMDVKTRRKYIDKAQICMYCLDLHYVAKKYQKHDKCKAFERPQNFTCLEQNCKINYLVCEKHKDRNREKNERNRIFWESRGKTFSTNVVTIPSSPESSPVRSSARHSSSSNSSQKTNNVFCSRSLNEASQKLKDLVRGVKVRSLPEGDPLFMFSFIDGHNRPLTCFWDQGCSHLMINSDVPEKELPAVMTRKGPLMISAAGDVSVAVKDEWMILVKRSDGSAQPLLGVTCDKVTTSFPMINTSAAYAEILSKAPENKKNSIKNLRVPDEVGGDPDLLIGIHYQCIYPEILFTAPSGLFIAKLKLKSTKGWNAVIGGPHRSFAHHAHQVGDPQRLVACFIDSIKNYKTLGAPKIPSPPVTHADIEFAKRRNMEELREIVSPEDEEDEPEVEMDIEEVSPLYCGNCGEECEEPVFLSELEAEIGSDKMRDLLPAETIISTNDADILDLRMMQKIQEQGISIDYRCVRCRNCSDCRDAAGTEQISFREEMEDSVIRTCVNIDLQAKKITARLPMRGDEAQYLSNNREIALKVLNTQCNKVKNDPETKELVLKAFNKLISNGYAVKFDDMSDEDKKRIQEAPVNHYLPWRVAHKPSSVTTPARAVFDASSKTPTLPDGRGGRCLNDLTMKGRVDTLDLLTMLLRFSAGDCGMAGDLRMFYTSIALDPSQWHLQRVLWKEGLVPEAKVMELVIITLIFGVRAVSALSERAILDLAKLVSKIKPRLAEMMEHSRFVDDLADSDKKEVIERLKKEADEAFESVGLRCKGWSITGSNPHPDVTSDGINVDVGGMVWCPALDTITVKIPPLHFGRKTRGKIQVGTEIFSGGFNDLLKFVPDQLTRRQVVSKFHSFFDPLGHFVPITAAMKVHMRMAVKTTEDWDSVISPDLRRLWVRNFWRLHNLRGIPFNRAKIPSDAVNTDMHLIAAVDAANDLKIAGVYARFLRTNGKWSSQLLIGRSLLAKEDSSIPKEELEAATIGSNLLSITRKALEGWVKDFMLISDSCITLCWLTAEDLRLSLFHRNRCIQVLMNTDSSKLFFVRTDQNPSDVATRADKVSEDSVGPDSIWERGLEWMTDDIEKAIENDIIKPASELRMAESEKKEFDKGLIFSKTPEILVHGHSVSEDRVSRIAARAEFSDYIIQPSKHNFRKIVKITALVFKFIRKLLERKGKNLKPEKKTFKMFPASFINWGAVGAGDPDGNQNPVVTVENEDIARGLKYWFRKGTAEVIEFNKPEMIKRMSVKDDDILYCKSRIQDGQRFLMTGEFPTDSLGLEIGLNMKTPLLDRWSPISYSVAMFIHELVAKHSGYETCHRLALEYVHIIQGASLFRQIGDECSKCKRIRKKYLEVVFGPVDDSQLTIAPPFHYAVVDIWGPVYTFVPGHERKTRNKQVESCKNYVSTFCCPTSKLCNLQVTECKNAEAVLEGLMRLGCEQGFPAVLILDQESSFMKMVQDAEVSLMDLQHRAYTELGINFKVAPVQGHNMIGLAERKIKAVQECFEKLNLQSIRMHSTGLQTVCKLIENNLNNMPIGYGYGRDADNSPILKIVTPNLLRVGRLNSRALTGPIRYPRGPAEYLKKVEDTYQAFFRIWNTSYVPKLIPAPKWYKDSPTLKPNDVVYFQKTAGELSSSWTVGTVENLIRSKDKKIRKVVVRYCNAREDGYRTTERAFRSLVKLFSIEDAYFLEDLAEVERRLGALGLSDNAAAARVQVELARQPDCDCCCRGHCAHSHFDGASKRRVEVSKMTSAISHLVASDICTHDVYPDPEDPSSYEPIVPVFHEEEDTAMAMLTALEIQFEFTEK